MGVLELSIGLAGPTSERESALLDSGCLNTLLLQKEKIGMTCKKEKGLNFHDKYLEVLTTDVVVSKSFLVRGISSGEDVGVFFANVVNRVVGTLVTFEVVVEGKVEIRLVEALVTVDSARK